MGKLTVAVIFGVESPEYGVSLQSAAAVLKAMDQNRYRAVMLGIDRQGRWFRYAGPLEHIAADRWRDSGCCTRAILSPSREVGGVMDVPGGRVTPLDAAFPVLHGKNGEDGTVQGLLALAGIPVIGCGVPASALCMDKALAHIVAANAGVAVPRGVTLDCPDQAPTAPMLTAALPYPLIVKPARGGSSLGITCVKNPGELTAAVDKAFAYDGKVVVEEKIQGFEAGCAILGQGDDLVIGALDEIELRGDLFDFSEKYTLDTAVIHMPARMDDKRAARVKNTAATIYRALGCTGFARVDLFLTPGGEIVFNEVNTIPGFTAHSRFANMLAGIGLSFPRVIDTIITEAVKGCRP